MVNRRSFFNVMLGAVASAAGVSVAKPIGAFVIIDPTKTWVLENGAPPGGGVGLDVGLADIRNAVMPLPYGDLGPRFVAYLQHLAI